MMMISYFVKIFYALLLLLLHTSGFTSLGLNRSSKSGVAKCVERERQALLKFTQDLQDDSGILSSWRDDENNRDCCKWKGIQCNNETGHVHSLNLRCPNTQYLRGVINISFLIDLQNMEYLDLSNNDFLWSHIPESIGLFTKLKFLNLSFSVFGGMIPSKLGNLSQLWYLDLGRNYLSGAIPIQIGNLKQLKYLDLGGDNNLSGAIPFQIGDLPILHTLRLGGNFDIKPKEAEWLSNLHFLTNLAFSSLRSFSHLWLHTISKLVPNLRELRLIDCGLLDNDISSLFHSHSNFSTSLTVLDLSDNMLTSSTFQLLFNISHNLQELYLSNNSLLLSSPPYPNFPSLVILDLSYNNHLTGDISSFIQNSSWCNRHIFQRLDLSYNRITGMLPKSIGLLNELVDLNLAGNFLEGDVTEMHLANLSKLKSLDLSYNSLSLKFVSSWVPPFQLTSLSLASCKLGTSFPSWLQSQTSLMYLDISDARLHGTVPEWFWNNLLHMIHLNMSYNNLTVTIPNIQLELPLRPSIILNSNHFEGEVPSFLRQASKLKIFGNKFSDLFSFLCDKSKATNLATLELSNNQIKGQLPDCWESVKSLLFLDLKNNKLSGKIPHSMGTLAKLKALVLRNNSLSGELPSSLKNCSNLNLLDVGENLLSGPIPSWIGENIQQLIILSMRGNRLSGNLPIHLCYLRNIQLLDLSMNNLSNGIPSCLKNLTAMFEKSIISRETLSQIYLYSRTYYESFGTFSIHDYTLNVTLMWKGVEYGFKDPELILKSIHLSCNNLTGEIPKEIGYLLGLVSLNLSRNNLNGEIPSEIGYLSSLEFVDLSRNQLSGRIPATLSKIDRLTMLDLSHNYLFGRIPLGRQLQTFDASNFEGNLDLCGAPLTKICPGDDTTIKPQGSTIQDQDLHDNSLFSGGFYMCLGLGYFTGFWGFLGPILFWQRWKIAYLRLLNKLTDYIYEMVVTNVAKFHL